MAWSREEMAARAAAEAPPRGYVSLGAGLPRLAVQHLPRSKGLWLHENGALAAAEAAGEPSAYFSTSESFDMVRSGHIDLCVLGALEADAKGDFSSWIVPGVMARGMGGAMDLAVGAKRVVILMEHVDKARAPRLVERCRLPVTACAAVDRVITNLGVFDIKRGRQPITLIERAPGVSLEDLQASTGARFRIAL